MLQKSPLNVTTERAENVSLSKYLGLFVISNLAVLDQVQLQYITINRINLYQWSYQKMLKVLLKIKHLYLSLSFLTFLLSEYINYLSILDNPWNFSFGLEGATNVVQGDSLKQRSLRWLDWIFWGWYLPTLSINYVCMSKDMAKRLPQLY